ncbi:hypothetical protein LTR37_012270 [Vermiconidia calcicola]|uniref:Uncharacterized protein n=1 Tax=Vermiconidia calcicola TaxID=1690605 RepID=A0ACC3N0J7_9PEZI|nr:hypothetical protein LTR37_012270 [Vermiconidia calcicola]
MAYIVYLEEAYPPRQARRRSFGGRAGVKPWAPRKPVPRRRESFRSRFGSLFKPPSHRRSERRASSNGSSSRAPLPGYELVKKLNTGGMSEAVTLVKKQGKLYITKRVRADGNRRQTTMSELKVLQLIKRSSSNNLNKLHDFQWDPRGLFCTFVLEYCHSGSLTGKIERYERARSSVPEEFAWNVLGGIAKALAFLHEGIGDPLHEKAAARWNSTWHLDLKPCNIFLSSHGQRGPYPRVVLGDFGCAVSEKDIDDGLAHPRRQRCGTEEWYPPEGLESVVGSHVRYGSATDVWQMGATIHVMCRLLRGPRRSQLDSVSPCGSHYSETLNSTVRQCVKNYRIRWTAAEVARQVHEVAKKKGYRM